MYVRLAWSEEQDAIATFGEAYRQYARSVPAFFPQSLKPAGAASK